MSIDLSDVKGYVDNQFTLLNLCYGDNDHSMCSMVSTLAYLAIFYLPGLVLFGVLTNILNIYVFWINTKKKTRQIIYLGALAFADIGNIFVMGVFWYIPAKGLPFITNGQYYFITMNESNFLCVLHRFLLGFYSCLTSNFFVLINLDRVLTIYFPLRFKTLPNKYSWILVLVVFVISFLLMVPILFIAKWQVTKDHYLLCLAEGALYWRVHDMLFANCGLLAAIIVIFTNIALVVKLLQIKRSRGNLQEGSQNQEKSRSKEVSACIVLMIVSFTFISLSLPMVISNLLAFYPQYIVGDTNAARYYYSIYDIGWILFLTQCSMNWIIYMWRMPSFRDANLSIIKCSKTIPYSKNEITMSEN